MYMSQISKLVPQLSKIEKDMLNLLSMFVFNHHLSIYQIHGKIKEKGMTISYKNVHKKVQKLRV